MNAGAINPAAIPIPHVDPEGVRNFGKALKHDGSTVADTGHDINAAWKGLTYSYHAPEAPQLLAAIAPVQAAGEDFKQAAATAGDALVAFAAAADYNLQRFRNLKASAVAFNAKIADNDHWREDAGLAEENDDLVQAVAFTALAYREQEAICANKIAALVGGTQTTPVKPGTATLDGIKTPWGEATGQDKPWYLDAGDAVKDFLGGSATDLAAMAGLVNEEGKLTGVDSLGAWWGNIRNSWGGLVESIAGLGGLHDPEEGWGWHGVDSLGESWKQLVQSFVPWQEWEHRKGYVATTGALNIGSLFIPGYGIAKFVTKLRKVSHRADADPPDPLSPDDLPRGPNDNPRLPSTAEIQARLQQAIDDLANSQDLDKEFTKLDDKLDDLREPEPAREPAMAGGSDHTPNIHDHHPDPSDHGSGGREPVDPEHHPETSGEGRGSHNTTGDPDAPDGNVPDPDGPEHLEPREDGYVDDPDSTEAARDYERIRNTDGDTERIANNTGIRQDVLDRIKKHIFIDSHADIALGPNQVRTGRFAPLDYIADLWNKAERGVLDSDEKIAFRKWAIHEAVESRLMEQGLPYRPHHPDYYPADLDHYPRPNPQHFGAHDLAPNEGLAGAFSHYGRLGLATPYFKVANDLSNVDELVGIIHRMAR